MNEVLTKRSFPRKEVSLGRGDFQGDQIAGVTPAALHDLLHEIRQPLGVIESLAYYLELTASEERVRVHLQRIQAMVAQANRILERSCVCPEELPLKSAAC